MKAVVPKGKLQGTHIGRVTTKAVPNWFSIGKSNGINPKYIKLLQRNDGYEYSLTRPV